MEQSGVVGLPSEQALERLLAGNRRYMAVRQVHPRQTVLHEAVQGGRLRIVAAHYDLSTGGVELLG